MPLFKNYWTFKAKIPNSEIEDATATIEEVAAIEEATTIKEVLAIEDAATSIEEVAATIEEVATIKEAATTGSNDDRGRTHKPMTASGVDK
ncbi:unnamed protein product [Lactuca saligna]|uniref:Uncharacterized protein n=1 Tax=Lactuca saligna TaxID=75948 RepID=A0AA36EHK4_LACSI|nr:unnamed protein product [Lactuca saligna]